jgi:DsbC/DsbD-like thiol-disulfide interchange protein
MILRVRVFSTFLCFCLFFLPSLVRSEGAPGWVQGLHSRVRLVSGDRTGKERLAGVEIALDAGFKTYWRNPGESGLPPSFDWAGSENVKSIEVRWPAPTRLEDATGVSYVYHDRVLLPVIIEAAFPDRPVRLSLAIDYGVCKDICIPAHAKLERVLGQGTSQQSDIEDVMRDRVPRPQPVGAPGDLAVVTTKPRSDGKPGFMALLKSPAGTSPALFVEGPEGWYFSSAVPDDHNRVSVTLDEKPKAPTGPISIRLTLVAGEKSIESEVRLDGNGRPR